eukprot:gb/GECG01011374.1/.p1 GENE.gb/GECG01011374.1/~~gb/GECG01011374.1/.p1  ORF type:complete len:112 (+),score=6.21 gb/GECG01011374.1/:1-336(+)
MSNNQLASVLEICIIGLYDSNQPTYWIGFTPTLLEHVYNTHTTIVMERHVASDNGHLVDYIFALKIKLAPLHMGLRGKESTTTSHMVECISVLKLGMGNFRKLMTGNCLSR